MRSKHGVRARVERHGYLFVLPFILAFAAFQAFPIIYTFMLGFTDFKGMSRSWNFVGFANYGKLLGDAFFWKAFGNTWTIWAFNFVPQIGFALLFAVWFTDLRLRLKGGKTFKALVYMPNLLTAASVAVLYATLFYYPNGPVNQILTRSGIIDGAFNFYRDPTFTRGIVAFIQFWMWYGHTLIMLSAGIAGIPGTLFESAVVDGANARQIFTRITLPLLRPVMLYILVTSLIGGMQMFDIPFLITNRRGDPAGSILTTAVYLYNHAFTGANNYAYASVVSVGLFILTALLAGVIFLFLRERNETGMVSLVPKKGGRR